MRASYEVTVLVTKEETYVVEASYPEDASYAACVKASDSNVTNTQVLSVVELQQES